MSLDRLFRFCLIIATVRLSLLKKFFTFDILNDILSRKLVAQRLIFFGPLCDKLFLCAAFNNKLIN